MRDARAIGACVLLVAAATGCVAPGASTDPASARYAVLVPPPDSEFARIQCTGAPTFDPAGDVPGLDPGLDLVGNGAFPGILRALDDNLLYIRLRLDGDPRAAPDDLIDGAWGWAVSTMGAFDGYDHLLLADGFGADTVRWLENTTTVTPDSPTEVAETELATLAPSVDFWHVEMADSTLGGDEDYFLTLGIPRTELDDAGVALVVQTISWFGTGSGAGFAALDGDMICHNAMGGPGPALSESNTDAVPLDPVAASFEPGGDADGDGLINAMELALGTDPEDVDSDDDGLPDGSESPVDSDGDGLVDALDPDTDNDLVLDGTESGITLADITTDTDPSVGNFVPDVDPTTTTFVFIPDSDGDGLQDGEEDANQNGAVDSNETDPGNSDTDNGGVGDGVEQVRGTDPLDPLDDIQIAGSGGCSIAGGGTPAAPWWLALPLALGAALARRRRRRRRRGPVVVGVLAAMALALSAAPASAQVLLPADFDIDLQRFKPSPGAWDILSVPTTRVTGHLTIAAAVGAHYAHRPLRFVNTVERTTEHVYVTGVTTLDVVASFGLYERFELGVAMPFVLNQGSDSAISISMPFGELPKSGTSDLRLVPKVLLGWVGRASLAVLVDVSLPTASTDALFGHGSVTLTPRVVGSAVIGPSNVHLAVNAGVAVRGRKELVDLVVGHALVFGVGLEVPFPRGPMPLALLVAVEGEVGLSSSRSVAVPVEMTGAVRWNLWRSMFLTVGAGTGLSDGYGTPAFRVLGAFGIQAVSLARTRDATTP